MTSATIEVNNTNGAKNPFTDRVPWVSFQAAAAHRLLEQIQTELKRVKSKRSKKRIHDARVALRRWFAIWHVMRDDGWESKKFRAKAIVPMEDLLAQLGEVRDMDVLLGLAKDLGCKDSFLEKIENYRTEAEHELTTKLKKVDAEVLVVYIAKYLQKRRRKMEAGVRQSTLGKETASQHMHVILAHHEQQVQKLQEDISDSKGMHHLRLGIKAWRYLLTEFFGLKSQELEDAQGLLGDIHDLDKLSEWLLNEGSNIVAISNLKQRRTAFLEDVPDALRRLPFGLRPSAEQSPTLRRS